MYFESAGQREIEHFVVVEVLEDQRSSSFVVDLDVQRILVASKGDRAFGLDPMWLRLQEDLQLRLLVVGSFLGV